MKPFKIFFVPVLLAACLFAAGCSDSESTITNPIVDTAPPAEPTGLKSCIGDCVIKLSWDPNITDADLAGYKVYRMAFGQIWHLTHMLSTETTFADRAPMAEQCAYGVTAIDETGNESGWAVITVNCENIEYEMHRQ